MEQQQYSKVFVESGTGQGKSYTAMVHALRFATLHRGRVVFATSSLILVDQVYGELANIQTGLKEKDAAYANVNVSIVKHTSAETLMPSQILRLFENGSFIVITVHNYLKETDDFLHLSTFFCLMMPFIKQTLIIVDEGHLFLNDTIRRLSLNETWGLVDNTWVCVNNLAVLNKMKDNISSECFEIRGNNYISYSVDVNKLQFLKFDTNNQSSKKYTDLFYFKKEGDVVNFVIDNEKIKKSLPDGQNNHLLYEPESLINFESQGVVYQNNTQKIYLFKTPKDVFNNIQQKKEVFLNFCIVRKFLKFLFDKETFDIEYLNKLRKTRGN